MIKVNDGSDNEMNKAQGTGSTERKLLEKRKKDERKKRIRRIVILVIVAVLIFFAVRAYNLKKQTGSWTAGNTDSSVTADEQIQATVYEVTKIPEIDISGYITAYDTQDVMLRTSGTVAEVCVKEGDRVTKGQLLAKLNSSSEEYSVANARLQLEKAVVNGTSAREMELLQMNLDAALENLERTNVYALFDGVVVSVKAKEGNYFQAGTVIMTVIDDSRYKATVEVDEIDVQTLEVGMKAELNSDSAPGETYEAVVTYIPMIGRYSDQGIGVMDVEIVIEEHPVGVKPGFSFEGKIKTGKTNTMVLVPQSAVTERRGVYTVQKLNEDGSVETVTIQAKYLGENAYQVLSGNLKSGDIVVYSPVSSGINALLSTVDDSLDRK
ncbi:MAG: efflux RND transporter periplasmic adaptor subunit [Sphaerochaetaceae bacterium]|nr:efflux RND transporter periplasmic adaptor subunit [Sphaerochaetaceae bacterium]